ncbi:MAG: hypothetical protein WBL74_08000 [Novosphingobium sp.]|uniref:hypothetical protein n=1 Tax=Novosphingobium sp. TaxID=1874826 RepID=UPI003C7D4435
MKQTTALFALATLLAAAAPALASSDYLLHIDEPKGGAAAAPVSVESWSFGVCNSGQCTSSTGSSGRTGGRAGSGTATYDLATNKGGRTAAEGAVATGDVDGDGSPDLVFTAGQDAIYGLSFTVDAAGPVIAAACKSGRIESATLSNGVDTFAVSSVSVVCTKGGSGAAAASYARSGITRIDSTPARISTNMTVGKQTQGSSFGEKVQGGLQSGGSVVAQGARCADGTCAASTMVTMTFTGGQMKHTKSGHVTLLK